MINTTKNVPIVGIYRIISPTGKIYIGQSVNIEKRWKVYKRLNCKNQIKLYNSLKKHGYDNHIFEIIERCSLEVLNIRETYWKKDVLNKLNQNWDKVLFCELYDKGGPKSEATKKKISESSLGKTKSQQHKNNIKKARIGMTFTQQHKDNMSNSRFRYQILCIETNTIYKSAHHASKELNIYSSAIIKVCQGVYSQTKGYTFKFM
jgi:group I intron endonuclease